MMLALSLATLSGACIGLGWWAHGAAEEWLRHRIKPESEGHPSFEAAMLWWTRATEKSGWLR